MKGIANSGEAWPDSTCTKCLQSIAAMSKARQGEYLQQAIPGV